MAFRKFGTEEPILHSPGESPEEELQVLAHNVRLGEEDRKALSDEDRDDIIEGRS